MAEKNFQKRVVNGVVMLFVAGMWIPEAKAEGRLHALCLGDALKEKVHTSAQKEREQEVKLMKRQGYSDAEIAFEVRSADHRDKVARGFGKSKRIKRQRIPRFGLTL